MRNFIDLHLKPSTPEQAGQMVNLAYQLGYKYVVSTQPISYSENNITVATRVDIEAKRGKELIDALKNCRRIYDIIAVKCLSKEVARQAAKDDRVDILLFSDDPAQRKYNWLDHHEAELVKGTGRAYEVDASELLATSPTHLSKMITLIKRDLSVAVRYDVPVVLSSGATTLHTMREPRALIALASLLDIDEEYAIDMISKIPEAIIKRNYTRINKEVH
ncbi:MAG: RNase P subunit p30 family protein [Candidatus Bathyarchaeia archaeon]|jgi:ribonuclease P/MRP protein subunit RPP1